jgi:hypothetical protein
VVCLHDRHIMLVRRAKFAQTGRRSACGPPRNVMEMNRTERNGMKTITTRLTIVDRGLTDPDHRVETRRVRLCTPHWPPENRLHSGDRRIGVAHLQYHMSATHSGHRYQGQGWRRIRRDGTCPDPVTRTWAQAITPPLMTVSGLAPKFSGFQRTRSARHPFATCPTRWDMPWVMALGNQLGP